MTRFYGIVGYGDTVESLDSPGVWDDVITEKQYYGDVIKNTKNVDNGDKVNDNVSVGNAISILADQYAINHFFKIKFVVWENACWEVSSVEVRSPRLILSLSKLYNGPRMVVVPNE